jgi:hypothetical protein
MENDHKQVPQKPTIDFNELFIKALTTILSYCGVPGVVLLMLYFFVINNGTAEQKQEIINSYVLLRNKETHFMVMYWSLLGLLAFIIIQHSYWKGRTRMQKEQIDEQDKTIASLQDKLNIKNNQP